MRLMEVKEVISLGKTPEAYQLVATKYKVHVDTVHNHVEIYEENGRLRTKARGGSRKKFGISAIMTIVNLSKADTHASLKELVYRFWLFTGEIISDSTVSRILNAHGIKGRKAKKK